MNKMLVVWIFFVAILLELITTDVVLAEDKVESKGRNNRVGIHILDESDLDSAATLVNSNGGEWGYVTLVIREDERSTDRWSAAFNRMKALKLTPIVRIATTQKNGVWVKPDINLAESWATFLDSLPWPTQRRYIVLFNEPNHSKEWGGEINPGEYVHTARTFWQELKKRSFNFFVLPAGFDAAAGNTDHTIDSKNYFDKMNDIDPLIFTIFDGWTSHSYPNPDFSGNPEDEGKMSIKGYEWEISYLAKYHLPESSPVFITETGWRNTNNNEDKIAEYYTKAFSTVWNSPKVQAITPFLLRYDAKPFNIFSWKIPGTDKYYPYYEKVLGISKVAGEPGSE